MTFMLLTVVDVLISMFQNKKRALKAKIYLCVCVFLCDPQIYKREPCVRVCFFPRAILSEKLNKIINQNVSS